MRHWLPDEALQRIGPAGAVPFFLPGELPVWNMRQVIHNWQFRKLRAGLQGVVRCNSEGSGTLRC